MGSKNYKVPPHIKKYVKVELFNYTKNLKLYKEILKKDKKDIVDTHTLLITERKLSQIRAVFNRLNPDQREIAEIIFFKRFTQAKAELEAYISYDAYYWTMNKVIFLVAEEMDLI